MAGTKEGAAKASKTIKSKNPDFFREIGAEGGKVRVKKGFATNTELASKAGRKGGKISKRPPDPNKSNFNYKADTSKPSFSDRIKFWRASD